MNCANCGAPMRLLLEQHHFICEYCTTVYFPEETEEGVRILEDESSTLCPACQIPLVQASIQAMMVLYCTRCRGILIPQAIFQNAIRSLRSRNTNPLVPPPFRPEELNRQLRCPQCSQKMETHPYGGPGNTVIDSCPRCQLNWLDFKELTRITRSPDRSGTESKKLPDSTYLFGSLTTGGDDWDDD